MGDIKAQDGQRSREFQICSIKFCQEVPEHSFALTSSKEQLIGCTIVLWVMKEYRKYLSNTSLEIRKLMTSSRGQYGQDYFTLRSVYLEGRIPKSVNMYWRRFAMSSIPLDDPEEFGTWLREKWTEKDALLEQYVTTGRFPESKDLAATTMNNGATTKRQPGFIESYVKTAHWWEFLQIFMILGACGLIANILARVWNVVLYGKATG